MRLRIVASMLVVSLRALAQDAATPPNAQAPATQDEQQPADELTEARQQISELQGQMQVQQQQLEEIGTRLQSIEQATNQNATVLQGAVQRQENAGRLEQARVQREQGVDQLLDLAAQIDLALMGGNRDIEGSLNQLEAGVRALHQAATQQSGREETDDFSGALASLAAARQAFQDDDLFLVRSYIGGAAGDIASARGSAAGNPQRAWAP